MLIYLIYNAASSAQVKNCFLLTPSCVPPINLVYPAFNLSTSLTSTLPSYLKMKVTFASLFLLAASQYATAFMPTHAHAFAKTSFNWPQTADQSRLAASLAENNAVYQDGPEIMTGEVDHKFELSVNRIKSMVYHWMSIFDENKGDAAPLADLMSPEGFKMIVTTSSEPITTIPGMQNWYAEFQHVVQTDNHIVQSIDVSKLKDGAFAVKINLVCPGIDAKGTPFRLSSQHNWEVVDYGGLFPRIRKFASHVINEGDGSDVSFSQVKV